MSNTNSAITALMQDDIYFNESTLEDIEQLCEEALKQHRLPHETLNVIIESQEHALQMACDPSETYKPQELIFRARIKKTLKAIDSNELIHSTKQHEEWINEDIEAFKAGLSVAAGIHPTDLNMDLYIEDEWMM